MHAHLFLCLFAALGVAIVGILGFVGWRSERRRMTFSNSVTLRHRNPVTRTADAAITSKFLLAAIGTSTTSIAICGAAVRPIGVFEDTADAGDDVSLSLFGIGDKTLPMVASIAITQGDTLYTAANGQVTNVSSAGVFAVGIALTSVSAGGIVEVEPRPALTAQTA